MLFVVFCQPGSLQDLATRLFLKSPRGSAHQARSELMVCVCQSLHPPVFRESHENPNPQTEGLWLKTVILRVHHQLAHEFGV